MIKTRLSSSTRPLFSKSNEPLSLSLSFLRPTRVDPSEATSVVGNRGEKKTWHRRMIRARTAIPPIRHPRFPENPPGPPDSSPSRLATVIRQEGWRRVARRCITRETKTAKRDDSSTLLPEARSSFEKRLLRYERRRGATIVRERWRKGRRESCRKRD